MKRFEYIDEVTGKETQFEAEAEWSAIATLANLRGCGCEDCQRDLQFNGWYHEIDEHGERI